MADKTVVVGSSVTLGQMQDFFRQLKDGSLDGDSFQAYLEHINPFEKTLRAAIAALKFDWVNSSIEKHFTLEPVRKERKVFHFDCGISSGEAERRMKAESWNSASLAELLDYAKNEWNGKDWLVALGSSAQVGGLVYVPCLYRYGAGRNLDLRWRSYDWNRSSWFLAARN